jgi:hypothetical protein
MDQNSNDPFEEEEKEEDIPLPTLPTDEDDLYACLNVSRTVSYSLYMHSIYYDDDAI